MTNLLKDPKRVVAISAIALLLILVFLSSPAKAVGSSYYVDCSAPSNGDGSSASPWNNLDNVNAESFSSGDQILLKRGTTCTGQLYPKGSGSSGSPIIVDAYGTGEKPLIAGQGNVDAAVYFYNQEYIELHNLEITNTGIAAEKRYGVHIVLEDFGTADFYRLTNLSVHDVNGLDQCGGHCKHNGGIMLSVLSGTVQTNFNDVVFDGNEIYSVDRSGISIWSYWNARPELDDGGGAWYPSTNFIFRNNIVYDTGGDGLVPHHTVGTLVEYNVIHDFNMRSSGANVGLWCWNCDDVVYQYNEMYRGGWNGNLKDSQGMDIDGGNLGNTYQYNYSHDNKGGMILICGWEVSRDNVIRYNISQNDGDDVIHVGCDNMQNTQFYNNTVYIDNPVQSPAYIINIDPSWLGADGRSFYFYNNIFYIDSNDVQYSIPADHQATFNSNLFYGLHPADEPYDPNKITGNPMMVNPGSGGTGINTVGGYQIQTGSAAIGAGYQPSNNGGFDYWGNPVPQNCSPDVGAHQFSPVGEDNCSSPISKSNWVLHYVDSEELNGEDAPAVYAFDENTSSFWHTEWDSSTPDHPHEIQINLGALYEISAFRYLPRQGNQNGNIKDYEFYVSTDGENWGAAVAAGAFDSSQSEKEVAFTTVTGQYIRFRSLSEVNDQPFANAAEISVLGFESTGATPTPAPPTPTSPPPTTTPTSPPTTPTSTTPPNTPTATSISPPQNLVSNPGFETGAESPWYGWGVPTSIVTDNVHSGSYAGLISGSQGGFEQLVSVSPNTDYTLTGWGKVVNAGDELYIGIKDHNGQLIDVTTYTQASVNFTTGVTETSVTIFCYKETGSGNAYCDDFELDESDGGPTATPTQTSPPPTATPTSPPPTPTPPPSSVIAEHDMNDEDWNGGTGWSGPYERVGTTLFTDYASSEPYGVEILNAGSLTRTVDMTGVTNAQLSFWWKTWSLESGEYAEVEVYDGTWHSILVMPDGSEQRDPYFTEFVHELSSYNMISDFKIRFTLHSVKAKDYFDIDDIVITGD